MTIVTPSESILYVLSDMQVKLRERAEIIQQLEERNRALQEVLKDFAVANWVEVYCGAEDAVFKATIPEALLERARALYSTEQ